MANVALNTVEKLQAKRSVFCLLIQTQEKYFYVLVSGENMLALKSKLSGGTLDLKKYGEVVEHGVGKPSQATMKRMKELYGCNHEDAIDF